MKVKATAYEKAEIKLFLASKKAKSFAKNAELIRQAKEEIRVIEQKK